jgi:hypothetical protein
VRGGRVVGMRSARESAFVCLAGSDEGRGARDEGGGKDIEEVRGYEETVNSSVALRGYQRGWRGGGGKVNEPDVHFGMVRDEE